MSAITADMTVIVSATVASGSVSDAPGRAAREASRTTPISLPVVSCAFNECVNEAR